MSIPLALHPLEMENTTTLPQPQPKKLSKGAIAGICVVCILVFLGLLGVTLYFTVFQKRNKGKSKFGSVSVLNQSGVASTTYPPGATIKAVYVPTSAGFGGEAEWNISIGGKLSSIQAATNGANNIVYTLPTNIFSSQCFLQVVDMKATQDYVNSPYFSIIPILTLTNGPGISEGDTFQNNTQITLSYDADATLPANTEWELQFSTATSFSSFSVVGSMVNSTANNMSFILTATPDLKTASSPYYWRVTTTNLKAQKYPQELTLEAPYSIGVPGITPSSAPTLTLQSNTGSTTQFSPGTLLTLSLSNLVLNASQIWQYSVNSGASYTEFTPTISGSDITWMIPNNLYVVNGFQVWLQQTTTNVISNVGSIYCTLSWDYPRTGNTITVWSVSVPFSQLLTTHVTVNGYFEGYTNWTVTISPDGGAAYTYAIPASNISIKGQVVTLQWTFNVSNVPVSSSVQASVTIGATMLNNTNPISRTTQGKLTLNSGLPTLNFGLFLVTEQINGVQDQNGGAGWLETTPTSIISSWCSTNCAQPQNYLPSPTSNVLFILLEPNPLHPTYRYFVAQKPDGSVNFYIWNGQDTYPVMSNFYPYSGSTPAFYRLFFIDPGTTISPETLEPGILTITAHPNPYAVQYSITQTGTAPGSQSTTFQIDLDTAGNQYITQQYQAGHECLFGLGDMMNQVL